MVFNTIHRNYFRFNGAIIVTVSRKPPNFRFQNYRALCLTPYFNREKSPENFKT